MKPSIARLIASYFESQDTRSNPLLYSVLHDLVHKLVFGAPPDRSPKYNQLLLQAEAGFFVNANKLRRDFKKYEFEVIFLLQNSERDNYFYPMLHALQETIQFERCGSVGITIVTWEGDVPRVCLDHLNNFAQRHGKKLNINLVDLKDITDSFVVDDHYVDLVFSLTEIIAKIDKDFFYSEEQIQESVESLSFVFCSFLKYLSKNHFDLAITTNDQWYPMSAAFSAAVSFGVPTILSYHGTAQVFALYSYADVIRVYTQSTLPSYGFPNLNGNISRFQLPLDVFIFNQKFPMVSVRDILARNFEGRGSTVGIVAALSGDLTYSTTAYSDSLRLILAAISRCNNGKNKLVKNLLILPHPSDKKNKYENRYRELIAECDVDLSSVKIAFGMNFFDFVGRSGPVIGCPSTALDTLLWLKYPIKIVFDDESLNNIFSYNPYLDSGVLCSDIDSLSQFIIECIG